MQHQDITAGFQRATQRGGEQFFLEFLDRADTLAFVKAAQGHMRALLNIQTGQRILDVGCGLGHEAQRIARLVGPGGAVDRRPRSPRDHPATTRQEALEAGAE